MSGLLNSKIVAAINEALPMYFVMVHHDTIELRAITYTYENGRERSRKLDEFSAKSTDDVKRAINIYIDLRKRLPIVLAPNIIVDLDQAWWNGDLDTPIGKLVSDQELELEAQA